MPRGIMIGENGTGRNATSLCRLVGPRIAPELRPVHYYRPVFTMRRSSSDDTKCMRISRSQLSMSFVIYTFHVPAMVTAF
jgi:hypothetical protein